MLRIEALTKHYEHHIALNQISLGISTGSIHGLVGKNGAGKTTLLKTIMGIYSADHGLMFWNEHTISEQEYTKQSLYFIPDTLYFSMFDTLETHAKQHRALYPSWSEARYRNLVNAFQLNVKKALVRFSKGEQRQVAFCLALATMPELLILDEPFDGLDPVIRLQIKKLLIQDVAERTLTVLISSHNLRELEDFCDAITLIHNGKIQLSNDIDLLKNGIHKVQVAFINDPSDLLDHLEILHHEQSGKLHNLVLRGNAEDIIKQLSALEPILLEQLPLSLEELFIYETEGLSHAQQDITL